MTPLRIAVFQHHPAEGPGRLSQWAHERGHVLTVFRQESPDSIDGFAAAILLGGPQSVNDVERMPAWLRQEMRSIDRFIARGVPVLGICLGAQLLAKALGAEVRPMLRPETGWTNIRFTDGLLLDVPQWHEEECGLPPQAVRLASSEGCALQAWRAPGRCIGLQFHAEWNEQSIDELNRAYGGASPFSSQSGERDLLRHRHVQEWCFAMLDAWLGDAGTAA